MAGLFCASECPSWDGDATGRGAEALQLLAAGAPVEDEVVRPHLVRTRWRLGPRTAGRDPLAGALTRNLQLRTPPQTMCTARTHRVAITAKEDPDAAVAVARILRRQHRHPRQHRPIP